MQNSFPTTETIHAAHNLSIEHNDRIWRLYNGTRADSDPTVRVALLDASATQILCEPVFAKNRDLAHTALSPSDVARVVVGWAPESRSWHLGLLLAAQPDSDYKPRWCGLASWPSGEPYAYLGDAQDAGQTLAQIINRPFYLIPAKDTRPPVTGDTQPLEITHPMDAPEPAPVAKPAVHAAPRPEPITLQAPPYVFETWVLEPSHNGFVLKRRPLWLVGTIARIAGFGLLMLVYLVLGIGTQISGLASVDPGWLPWLGLAVAIVLSALVLRQAWKLLSITDMIVDTSKREVRMRQRFTGITRWRLPFEKVAYVLVSQTPARPQGFRRQSTRTAIIQDAWLHLSDGTRFYPVVAVEEVDGISHQWDHTRQRQKTAGRRKLSLSHYDTPLHHAAQSLANTLQTALWLDIR